MIHLENDKSIFDDEPEIPGVARCLNPGHYIMRVIIKQKVLVAGEWRKSMMNAIINWYRAITGNVLPHVKF